MTVYLELGAVRIQSWLGRWSDLRGRRGASALLVEKTGLEATKRLCQEHELEMNPQAPQVDGRVSLIDPLGENPKQKLRRLLTDLAGAVPGLEFEAAWGEGQNYSDVYKQDILPARERGEVERSLAPSAEIPLVSRCELTGTDLAVGFVTDASGTRAAGRDAVCRDGAANRRSNPTAGQGLDAEARLAEATQSTPVRDFDHLASLGPPDEKRNHLATLFIDGNRIGDLFASLQGDSDKRDQLSRTIHTATEAALRDAADFLMQDQSSRVLPVVPHIVGGDDVLVSVPAAWAVKFSRCFLRSFEKEVGSLGIQVSASAGVVIAHTRYPLARSLDHATELLATAKAAVRGQVSSLLVADMTREQATLPGIESVWASSELDRLETELEQLAMLGKSERQELLVAAGHEDVEISKALIGRQLHRADHEHLVPSQFRDDPRLLLSALELTRWWG